MVKGYAGDPRIAKDGEVFIEEYLQLERLAKLGFTRSHDHLSAEHADIYCLIGQAIDEAQSDKNGK